MKRYWSLFAALVASLLAAGALVPSIATAQGQSQGQPVSPCDDPLFVSLKAKPLDQMSTREYEYFKQKDTDCSQYQRLLLERQPQQTHAGSPVVPARVSNQPPIREVVPAREPGTLVTSYEAPSTRMRKGTTELQGSAGFSSVSIGGESETTILCDLLFGYCFSSNFEFAPQVTLQNVSSGSESLTQFGGIAGFICNFPSGASSTVPFIEFGIGYGTLSAGGGALNMFIFPAVGGGLRFLLGNSASINLEGTYQRSSLRVGGYSGSASSNTFGVRLGLSVFPSKLN